MNGLMDQFSVTLISDLHGCAEVLLVEGNAELVHKAVHLIGCCRHFLLFLLFFSLLFLLLHESNLVCLLLLLLGDFSFLGILLSFFLFLLFLDLCFLFSSFLQSKLILLSDLPIGSFLLGLGSGILLSLHVGLSLLNLGELFLLLRVGLILHESLFFEFESLLGLHLLLDLEHLELSLS